MAQAFQPVPDAGRAWFISWGRIDEDIWQVRDSGNLLKYFSLDRLRPGREAGKVFCTAHGCGYQTDLKIGGGKASPAVTGYCAKDKKFVNLKLKSWADYRKPHNCPGGKDPLQPIYEGAEVTKVPCPKCGNLTLSYKRRLLFD